MYGYTAAEAVGKPIYMIVPAELHEEVATMLERIGRGERIDHFDTRRVRKDGSTLDVSLTISPTVDAAGAVTGASVIARDITDRAELERQRARLLEQERDLRQAAERAEKRSSFLAESTTLLERSLDYETTLHNLARLVVPALADACMIDTIDEERAFKRVAVASTDATREELAWEVGRRWPTSLGVPEWPTRVIRSGEPQLISEVSDDALRAVAQDDEHLRVLRGLGFTSSMVVPLRARGRTLGAISFASAESGRRYTREDLDFALDLARRAGLAVDNARLYGERSYIARTLQESLLPPILPEIKGLDTAARFHAAGEGNEMGGDFYDLFDTGHSHWGVLIGDVCGKGADAAAVTAVARYTLRAAAMQEEQPSRILRLLNEALLQQRADRRFCTVAFASLEVDNGGARLDISSGGHPLPYVLRSRGDVESAGRFGTLLGIVPDVSLSDTRLELESGDALVLYTDGVTEARGDLGMFGPERLASLLESCAGLDAAGIAERIESAVLGIQNGEPKDDIAIVVLRIPD
jgi:PAS domain S-box-containing protein